MKFKRLELTLFLLITVLMSYCAFVSVQQSRFSDDFVRFRIIADGNDMISQSKKLLVRDAVAACCSTLLADAEDADIARKELSDHMDEVNKCIRSVVGNQSYFVTIEECRHPSRTYGDFSLPAGRYIGLQIRLGSAQGKNWWCVLYPTLCSEAFFQGDNRFDKATFSFKSAELVSAFCEKLWS